MSNHIILAETILFVKDQETSTRFYERILKIKPSLNVPGMTEFELTDTCKIGLMPNKSIAAILEDQTPHPDKGTGIPRCELYLLVENVEKEFDDAIKNGARKISAVQERDWGHKVGYFSDPDGHIVAFAGKITAE